MIAYYINPDKQREYCRKWIAGRRAEYFKDKQCVFCNSTIDLELDHIDKSTKIDHKIWSWSKERREAEIAKCRILCEKCHIERHAAERRKPRIHGSNYAYNKGCRCDLCKKVHSIKMLKYRIKVSKNKTLPP